MSIDNYLDTIRQFIEAADEDTSLSVFYRLVDEVGSSCSFLKMIAPDIKHLASLPSFVNLIASLFTESYNNFIKNSGEYITFESYVEAYAFLD